VGGLSVFVLERELKAYAVSFDLAVCDNHVLLRHLGDAQVTECKAARSTAAAAAFSHDVGLVPTISMTL
jgi:hypothetical protein